jgi:hypothetical protein
MKQDSLRHADRLGVAQLVQLLHLSPRSGDIPAAQSRVVNKIKVYIVDAKLGQRRFAGLAGIQTVSSTPLGSQPDIFARQPAFLDCFANLLLV